MGLLRAVIEFLHRQNISDSCLVLYGNSIGGSVAVQMATGYRVDALILQAPFTSLGDVGWHHLPIFPVKWLIKDRYDSISKVDQIKSPTLIIHGDNDQIISPKFSQSLFDVLPEQKQRDDIPNRGHNNLFEPNILIQFIDTQVNCEEYSG